MKYFAPSTVDEAVAILSEPDRQVFAGATDVVPQMRAGKPAPEGLVDLKKIERLVSVTHESGRWVIGAAAPTARLTGNAELAAAFPGLVTAAGLIGSDQIQGRSSLGGNLCNASPAADSVPAMVANAMRAVIAGPEGTRTVAVEEIPTGPGQTTLGPGEFVVEFELDDAPPRTGDSYLRLTPRTEMDIAIVGAGASISLAEDGTVASCRLALGAVAPTVVRVADAEAALTGSNPDDEAVLAAVAAAASAACNPIDDKRGTVAYRTHTAGVLARRAVASATEHARGGQS